METGITRTLLVPLIGVVENKKETAILENQMQKKMENEMETGIIYYRTLLVPLIGDIWSLIVGT